MTVGDVQVTTGLLQSGMVPGHERCTVDAATLAAIGCAAGDQVRIRRSAAEFALYTVVEARPQDPPGTVRMGPAGRERLGGGDGFDAVIDSQVPEPSMTDADASAAGEFVERLALGGDQLIVIAPHGGMIEQFTDSQAEWCRDRLPAGAASSWLCRGWRPGGGASERWHITSTDLEPSCFPLLRTVADRRFAAAVAFHGFDDPAGGAEGADVLVGGAAALPVRTAVVAAVGRALDGSGIGVRLAPADDQLGGGSSRNIVNRLTVSGFDGLQIEQPLAARRDHGQAVAEAVAEVYRRPATSG